MGLADMVILLLLGGAVAGTLIYMRKQKKEGKSCCGCSGCSGCSGSCSTIAQKKEDMSPEKG